MSEQTILGEKVEIKNLPKEDIPRRMSQLEAAVLTMADSVNKIAKSRELTVEEKAKLEKRADVALKDAAKNVDDFRKLKVGQVVHTHGYEDENFNIQQRPCLAVEYKIRNPQGIRLNSVLLTGTVIVPQCTANDFHAMDSGAEENERALYSNKGRTRNLAELRG